MQNVIVTTNGDTIILGINRSVIQKCTHPHKFYKVMNNIQLGTTVYMQCGFIFKNWIKQGTCFQEKCRPIDFNFMLKF